MTYLVLYHVLLPVYYMLMTPKGNVRHKVLFIINEIAFTVLLYHQGHISFVHPIAIYTCALIDSVPSLHMPSAMGEKYNYLNMVMYGCGLAKGANEYLMAHVTI